jgi:AcrR family transcriptional regulator
MASVRRSSLSARDKRATSRNKGTARTATPRVVPLYKRLPHGPHRLNRNEVIANQRTRIHGAMIEAVSTCGYEQTSVKQVIGLAGVSRRSFYEQFANKQGCFLVTFDLLAKRELHRMRGAYMESEGTLAQRSHASFERFAQMLDTDTKTAVLLVLEAQTAGVPGVLALVKTINACEQMLAQSFSQAPDAVSLPMPIVRAVAGGLHGASCGYLRDGVGELDIAQELLAWTLQFQTPAAERMSEHMTAALSARLREIASTYGHGFTGAEAVSRDERERMLQAVLRLATRESYQQLSAPQIADEANVSIDAFCEQFTDRDECFVAALDAISDELLTIAADPGLVSEEWPHAVRRVLAELMRYLADHPLHTRTLAQEAFFAGREALERVSDLAFSIATLLTEGAPEPARTQLNTDAVAGAIWHTIRCQVAAGRPQLLAALSDHLAYIVLTPHLGAQATAEILSEELPSPAQRETASAA